MDDYIDNTLKLIAIVGYLLGSIPFGLLLTRAAGLGDIRKIGSGSIGATNVLRTGNKKLAAATVLLDAAKGAVAVLIAARFAPDYVLAAGLAAVIGHMFPVWLKFKGGKGVATGLGVMLAASPLAALAMAAVWLAMGLLFRISSLAALTTCVVAPFLVWLIDGRSDRIVLAAIVAVLIFVKHQANIRRLLAGTEPRIGQKQ
jgi:acyl phosphate:glycerol-3-phosphate acyltransferase